MSPGPRWATPPCAPLWFSLSLVWSHWSSRSPDLGGLGNIPEPSLTLPSTHCGNLSKPGGDTAQPPWLQQLSLFPQCTKAQRRGPADLSHMSCLPLPAPLRLRQGKTRGLPSGPTGATSCPPQGSSPPPPPPPGVLQPTSPPGSHPCFTDPGSAEPLGGQHPGNPNTCCFS